jgi:hypothetical protein
MRHSSFWTTSARLALAGAVGSLLLACGEGPGDPVGPDELAAAFHHKEGHGGGNPATGGGNASITILQQPDVQPNAFVAGHCIFPYSFEVEVKGLEREVRWRTFWQGGDHDDGINIGSNTITVGTRVGGVVVSPTPGHPDDTHSFDALRIEVLDGTSSTSPVLTSALTEGRTNDG